MGAIIHYPPVGVDLAATSSRASVFLAGTIDMGQSRDWQQAVVDALQSMGAPIDIFNPRRDDWDPAWGQDMASPEFHAQVTWELDHIEAAQIVVFNFEAGSQSPVTLLELGIVAADPTRDRSSIIVCCPPGFWRRGNVQIVCARYGIECVATLDDLIAELTDRLKA